MQRKLSWPIGPTSNKTKNANPMQHMLWTNSLQVRIRPLAQTQLALAAFRFFGRRILEAPWVKDSFPCRLL